MRRTESLAEQPKLPTIVLFDLDGTLVHHLNPKVLQLLEFLDDCSHRTGRLVARFRLARRRRNDGARKAPRLLVHRAIHRVRRKSVEDMLMPCETMRRVLERLGQRGVLLGLVSNGLGRGYGQDVLNAFDLRKYFSACVFREDVSRGKPHPDSILAALAALGRPIRSTDVIWYVGDQRKDVHAAQAASRVLQRSVQPFALGARAAMTALEGQGQSPQVMLTPADLEHFVEKLLRDDRESGSLAPLPAASA